jgi:SGNH hydrolase-like domain, acetyltransferase AlgX
MGTKPKTYSPLLLLALFGLTLPMLLTYLNYAGRSSKEDLEYNKPDLTGLVISDVKPELTRANWFNATYQKESDDYNNDHWALKETMVRWNNQLYYDLFRQIRVNGFVSGKDDYIFSEGYIFSAFGDDLIPEEQIKTLLQKAKVVQDTLKAKGIDLLLVYAPGKGQYCKEYIQDKYVHPVKTTNHARFINYSREFGLQYLDLLKYFENMKSSTPYPLFPKFGHHWSYYGACVASDTIIGTIEHLQKRDLPDLSWKEIEVVDTARSRDADVLKSMNLLSSPSQNTKLAYPRLLFEQDSVKNSTRVLTISDSYWYDQVYMGVPQNCFAGGQFWYYYNRVIPSPRQGEKVEVWQLDLKREIESNKVIMLLYSDGNLPKFGNHFIEDAYELYTSPASYAARTANNKQIQQFAKEIRESPVLLKKATANSANLQIPLDSAIRLDAMKMAGLIK